MKKIFCLVFVVSIIFSCKKADSDADSVNSELWVKVDKEVPDFIMKFRCGAFKKKENIYTVSYTDKTIIPNLKTIIVNENGIYNNWILVYTNFGRTDEIILQLANGKIYKAKGFEFREKRLIEIFSVSNDNIEIVDRDISIIEKLIYID
jgi:hypothetical protein